MSEVEDILERIKNQPGVEGYIICNQEGAVVRRSPAMSQEMAEKFAESMKLLTFKARNVARDLEPRNDLRNIRIRLKRKEVLVSFDQDFFAAVIQNWTPST